MMRWFAFSAFLVSASVAAFDIAWRPAVEVIDGRGVRGPWQQNESNYDYVDDPSVAIDDAGKHGHRMGRSAQQGRVLPALFS